MTAELERVPLGRRRPALRARRAPEETLAALTALPGVGPARAAALERIGVECVRDLCFLLPRALESWPAPVPLAEARAALGKRVRVEARVLSSSLLRTGRKRSLLRVRFEDGASTLDALFFNQPWLAERFVKGARFELCGRVVETKKGPTLAVPRVGSEEKPLPAVGAHVPVYPTAKGLSQELVRKLAAHAVERLAAQLEERLPPERLAEAGLPRLGEAVRELHAPRDLAAHLAARRRVALEGLLALQARLAARRAGLAGGRARAVVLEPERSAELARHLPHAPTPSQRRAMDEIAADLARPLPMRRLLQGDVGSGKTLVGLWACLVAASEGGQCAFLAPTELLAEQHHAVLAPLVARAGLRCGLLTGSLAAREREQLLRELAEGRIELVVGTHALFSSDVRYADLALCVIDEQQRFGVAQRARLLEKGADVHALLMSATPIPRTLALSLWGDLELSELTDKPPGRGRVRTRWLPEERRAKLLPWLAARLARGERAYWVVPRIGEDEREAEEGGEGGEEPREDAEGAEALAAKLARGPLARHGIELVHGRMPADERARRLARFRAGEVRLLVATTVIEVGLDVPEASVLVVQGAERLGLAQLHQLRGRVGRGASDGWCLLAGAPAAEERCRLLERVEDGFALAEEDLRRRGMGDLGGLRQSGASHEGFDEPELDLELVRLARSLCAHSPALRGAYAGASEAPTP